jgi:hypothetical protein
MAMEGGEPAGGDDGGERWRVEVSEANGQAFEIHFNGLAPNFAAELRRRLTDSTSGL